MKSNMVTIKKTGKIQMKKGKYMKHIAKGKVSTKFMASRKSLNLGNKMMARKGLPKGQLIGEGNVKIKLIQGKDGKLRWAIPKNAIFGLKKRLSKK